MGMARGQKKKNLAQNRPEQKYGAGGESKLSMVDEERQNRGEKETKLRGNWEGCNWQVWMWDERREVEEEKRTV